jgi:AcrR family transcriptional regulator
VPGGLLVTAMSRHPKLANDEILRRARSVFVERGYGARTRQISAAVGLTWGAIALRFVDKPSLFRQAMTGLMPVPAALECERSDADLPGLLERVRCHLWERWPLRLQYRLAPSTAGQDEGPDGLQDWLAGALEAQARRGVVRSDMSAKALAQVVLALLTGDVAQGFVARERTLPSDPAFIGRLVCLLSAN